MASGITLTATAVSAWKTEEIARPGAASVQIGSSLTAVYQPQNDPVLAADCEFLGSPRRSALLRKRTSRVAWIVLDKHQKGLPATNIVCTNRPLRLLAWFATLLLVSAGVLMSAVPEWGLRPLPFIAFLTGHLLWSGICLKQRNAELLALNLGLGAVDVYAAELRSLTVGWF